MKSCETCSVYPNLIGAYIIRHDDSSENSYIEINIPVKFCPTCGKRLANKEDKN